MTKLLVVDQQRSARRGLKDDLTKLGYEVQEATTTETGLEMALKGGYAAILVDVQLAIKDDWNVLQTLKGNRQTKGTPVMMLTAVRSDKNEAIGLRMGAPHFIPKPWHPDGLALTVRVALREAEERARLEIAEEHLDDVYPEEEAPTVVRKSNKSPYDTGGKVVKLDKLLGGGIAIKTLSLFVGNPGAGKSVICQYLIYGAIVAGRTVTYISTDHTASTLADQMATIDLDISRHVKDGQLDIRTLERPASEDDPNQLPARMVRDIESAQPQSSLVIVDSISNLAQISEDRSILNFIAKCQGSCTDGKTVVIVSRDSAFDPKLLPRLNDVFHNYFKFGAETVGNRTFNKLQVQKLNNAVLRKDNLFGFLVEPQLGIHVVPFSRFPGPVCRRHPGFGSLLNGHMPAPPFQMEQCQNAPLRRPWDAMSGAEVIMGCQIPTCSILVLLVPVGTGMGMVSL